LENGELVKKLLKAICDEFVLSLQEASLLRSRMLIRLLCAFIPWRVITTQSLFNLLNRILDRVLNLFESNGDPTGRSWQPWTDHLVHIVLMGLPWGGTDLMQGELQEQWTQLFQKIQTYIDGRPIHRDVCLSPFLAPIKENDTAARYI